MLLSRVAISVLNLRVIYLVEYKSLIFIDENNKSYINRRLQVGDVYWNMRSFVQDLQVFEQLYFQNFHFWKLCSSFLNFFILQLSYATFYLLLKHYDLLYFSKQYLVKLKLILLNKTSKIEDLTKCKIPLNLVLNFIPGEIAIRYLILKYF